MPKNFLNHPFSRRQPPTSRNLQPPQDAADNAYDTLHHLYSQVKKNIEQATHGVKTERIILTTSIQKQQQREKLSHLFIATLIGTLFSQMMMHLIIMQVKNNPRIIHGYSPEFMENIYTGIKLIPSTLAILILGPSLYTLSSLILSNDAESTQKNDNKKQYSNEEVLTTITNLSLAQVEEVPQNLLCAISLQIVNTPVKIVHRQTQQPIGNILYDFNELQHWIIKNSTLPVPLVPFDPKIHRIVDDHDTQKNVDEFLLKQLDAHLTLWPDQKRLKF